MDKYVTSTPRSRNPSVQSDTPRSTNPNGFAESESDASDIQLPEFSSPELMPGTSRAEDMDIADTEAEQAEGGHGSRRDRVSSVVSAGTPALDGSSKRGRSASGGGRDAKSLRQGCIEEAMAERFDQQKTLDLFYEWIIRDMLPTITTESEALRAFLNYLNPQFKLPSRKKLGDDIKHMSARAKYELT
ncbi:uncharacterized protein LOC143032514 [Oratosquilla oratoria]|uniref:uncharacterized protein LOC143032514 n=1 Tax=Oratosquilla oratoria TaxID=337810 RepID=UPI003F768474